MHAQTQRTTTLNMSSPRAHHASLQRSFSDLPFRSILMLLLILLGCRDTDSRERTGPESAVGEPSQPKAVEVKNPSRTSQRLLQTLDQLRRRSGARYTLPTTEELSSFESWLDHILDSAEKELLPSQPAPSGFYARFASDGNVWILAEKEARGAGTLSIRLRPSCSLVIEAPHAFFDQHTLQIATAAFEQLQAHALLNNTVHRGGRGTSQERRAAALSGKSKADIAHAASSFFNTAHRQLSKRLSEPLVVQIHGYEDGKVPGAEIIVSAAGTKASPKSLVQALNDTLQFTGARSYPDQVQQLGGTTNRQAKVSRALDLPFIHLELSSRLRKQLVNDPARLRLFVRALALGLGLPPPSE